MQPNSLKSRMVARVLWLAFGLIVGGYELSHGLAAQSRAQEFLGLALILSGLASFLQPPSLTGQLGQVDPRSKATAVGPAWLRALLTLGSFACFVIALYFWISGHGWLTRAA